MRDSSRKVAGVSVVCLVILGTFTLLAQDVKAQGAKPEWTEGDHWDYSGSGRVSFQGHPVDATMLIWIYVKETTRVTVNQSTYDVYHCNMTFTVSFGQIPDSGYGDVYIRTTDIASVAANTSVFGSYFNVTYEPPFGGLEFPLAKGAAWSSESLMRSVFTIGGGQQYENASVLSDYQIAGQERVTVPAGTFDTYNITAVPRGEPQNASASYYSDEVGNVVKSTGGLFGAPFPLTFQLKSYKYEKKGQAASTAILIVGVLVAVIVVLAVLLIAISRRKARRLASEHPVSTEYGEVEEGQPRFQPPPSPPKPPGQP